MTKEELEKEAENKGIKYADSLEYTISKFSDEEGYCWSQVEQAYEKGALDFAEPREERIVELEATNKKISDECHKLVDSLEKKQNKNELLETQNIKLQAEVSRLTIKNAELKDEWQEQVQKATDEGYARTLQTMQLSKAKELLNEFMRISKASDEDFEHDYSELIGEAEQFIKENK